MSGTAPQTAAATTVGALLAAGTTRLAAAGVDEPRREARLVLALALGIEPAVVLGWPERAVAIEDVAAVEALLARRAGGEPFSRLRGKREFWGLDFALSSDTLDPRPDSETLVAAALADIPDRDAQLRVIDFGTGTGCLLLALLSELPRARGLGIDIAPGAVTAAQHNAEALGLATRASFQVGGWDCRIEGLADVILANPPYIPTSEIAGLARTVKEFDPVLALDGGPDGLAAYRPLAAAIRRLLAPSGSGYIEIGADQASPVAQIVGDAGMTVKAVKRDLAERERCLVATL